MRAVLVCPSPKLAASVSVSHIFLMRCFDPGQNGKSAQSSGEKDSRVVRWFSVFVFSLKKNFL